MRARKLFPVVCALLLVMLSAAAMAQDTVVITEGFFNPKPFSAQICAQTIPGIPNAELTFYAESVYGHNPIPAMTTANSLGYGCAKATWPVGVYSVQVNADSLWSPFVAVTVAPENICCGVVGGGALALFHYGTPKNITRILEPRFATFGILYDRGCDLSRCARVPFQLLYFDHDNPQGPISFVAKSFMQIQFGASPNPGSYVTFVGNGLFQQGANPAKYVRYYVEAVDGDPDQFYLEIRNFAGQIIYQSSIGIGFEGEVINGEVFVDCAG